MQNKPALTNEALDVLIEKLRRTPENFKVIRRLQETGEFPLVEKEPDTYLGVVLDTETTGNDIVTDSLIELGMVFFTVCKTTLRVRGIYARFNQLDDPGQPISAAATAINGITDDMVKGHRIDEDIIDASLEGVDFIIAHNAGFDRPICEKRLPIFETIPWGCSFKQVDWKAEGIGSAKLDYIAYQLGFFFDGHRAEIDCIALLLALDQALPITGTTGLQQVLKNMNTPTKRIAAVGAPFDTKDVLRAQDYFWADGTVPNTDKAWTKDVPEDALTSELQWLKQNGFKNKSVGVPVRVITGLTRFTNRLPPAEIVYC
ncbi:MAG: 3'-5' exonuclease [Agitococcus sp.]|nr:3'-5' exonuclease [Agitococcus sp.]MDO9177047.1 3'-5' exonuclease [Agitococcus sp.]